MKSVICIKFTNNGKERVAIYFLTTLNLFYNLLNSALSHSMRSV